MNEIEKKLKYYEFFLTGEIEKDTNGNPVKDTEGKIKVKYTRISAPSKALLEAGLTANKFFQCEAVEVNVGADKLTASGSGKTWDIGPMVDRGMTVNIFENRQREPFKAIKQRFNDKTFTVIVDPNKEDSKGENPVIHLTNWALPGKIVEYETGFPYYVHTRNSKTKVMEPLLASTYTNQGELTKKKVIKTTGKLFLFANEVETAEAHIKDAISTLVEFKVPASEIVERKDEILAQETKIAETKSTTTKPEGADI